MIRITERFYIRLCGADCASDHELLIAKFRLKLKTVGETTRPFRYDQNQIPYDYTVEVRNIFQFSSVHFNHSVVSNSLRPHESRSKLGLPVRHHLPEFSQTHIHRVRDAIQPSHPQSSPSPPAPNPSQHQSLVQ